MEKYYLTPWLKEFYMNNRCFIFFCLALVLFCGSVHAMDDGPPSKKRKLSENISEDNKVLVPVLPYEMKKLIIEFYLKDLICRSSCSCRIFKYYKYIGSVEEFSGMAQDILKSFITKFDDNDIRATIFTSEPKTNPWIKDLKKKDIRPSCWYENSLINPQKIKQNLFMFAIHLNNYDLVEYMANKDNAFFNFENKDFNLSSLTFNCSGENGAGKIYVRDYKLYADVSSLFTFVIDCDAQNALQVLIQHGSKEELSYALWYAVKKDNVGVVSILLNCDDVALEALFEFYDEFTDEDKTIYVDIVQRAQKLGNQEIIDLFNECVESYSSTEEWNDNEVNEIFVSESTSEEEQELEEYFE